MVPSCESVLVSLFVAVAYVVLAEYEVDHVVVRGSLRERVPKEGDEEKLIVTVTFGVAVLDPVRVNDSDGVQLPVRVCCCVPDHAVIV